MFGPPSVPKSNAAATLGYRDWLYREEDEG
jgi:hypothetical protein